MRNAHQTTPNQEVAAYFDRHSSRYDEMIASVDFQLDDAYAYMAEYALSPALERAAELLELGVGTGKLTKYLLERDPRAHLTGVDISRQMLEQARRNLVAFGDRVSLVCGEFPQCIPEARYDRVLSAIALTFYTLDHTALYRTLHRLLRPAGLFVYAANVVQHAASVEDPIADMLVNRMSLSEEQARFMQSIKGPDIFMASVDFHLQQLRYAGFIDVDCIYLRYKLAIVSGRKPGPAVGGRNHGGAAR